MKTSLCFLTCLFVLFSAAQAESYELKRTETGALVRWRQTRIDYKFHVSMGQSAEGQQYMEAIRQSFGVWQKALNQQVQFQSAGYTQSEELGYDTKRPESNENSIVWVRRGWSHHPDAMAITLITYRDNSGEILDADIAFNGELYQWYVATETPVLEQKWAEPAKDHRPLIEVANTATHEIGHFLGLSHSEEFSATMYHSQEAKEESKRDLHQDDLEGIAALYQPVGNEHGKEISSFTNAGPGMEMQMGCSSMGREGQTSLPLWLGGLLLLLLFRSKSSRTLPMLCVMAGLCWVGSGEASATVGVGYDLKTLTSRSGLVVTGIVGAQKAQWLGKRIYTFSAVSIQSCHKGKCQQKQVVIQQLGGVIGGIGMKVEGVQLLSPKSQVLLFLYQSHGTLKWLGAKSSVHQVVGLSQGVFRYAKVKGAMYLQRSKSGIAWHQPSSSKTLSSTSNRPAVGAISLPAKAFVEQVKVWVKAGQKSLTSK